MITRQVRIYMLKCPALSGKKINVNFLGHTNGSLAIEPCGELSVVRKYCDGKRLYNRKFCLSLRCAVDQNVVMNEEDTITMENVARWILEQNTASSLPVLSAGRTPVGIMVEKAPYLSESSVQGAKLQMEFAVLYVE